MQYTNKLNLPAPIVEAVKRDTYSKGKASYSATGLLRPPQMAALYDNYSDFISKDVSQELWTLFGSAVHLILEGTKAPEYITEERYTAPWRVFDYLGK